MTATLMTDIETYRGFSMRIAPPHRFGFNAPLPTGGQGFYADTVAGLKTQIDAYITALPDYPSVKDAVIARAIGKTVGVQQWTGATIACTLEWISPSVELTEDAEEYVSDAIDPNAVYNDIIVRENDRPTLYTLINSDVLELVSSGARGETVADFLAREREYSRAWSALKPTDDDD